MTPELLRVSKVITFWLRTTICDPNVSHSHLVAVILSFYSIEFGWDASRSSNDVKLSNDNKRFLKTTGVSQGWNTWTSLCSSMDLSGKRASKVRWEVTQIEKQTVLRMHIGFIDGDYIDDFDPDACIGDEDHEVALEVVDKRFPRVWEDSSCSDIHQNWRFDTKTGDRIRLELDFVAKECTAYYNDEKIGLISQKLPNTCYLAASVYNKSTSFETTLFEIL